MTCPTVSVFDGLKKPIRKIKIGRSLRLFGDGFQKKDTLKGRKLWRIPVMEGDFIIQEDFGIKKAVAGGNFIILAESQDAGLLAAEEAVNAISKKQKYVVMPFPGGICRSGSKIGSLKYKLPASTNHVFCPKLKYKINGTLVPEKTKCVYEIVINGLSFEDVKRAMSEGVKTATRIEGINRISAGNYDGKFGSMKIFLKDIIK
jgi:formylmethanofuran--tetrahydromethanopterin N-formyltransferase